MAPRDGSYQTSESGVAFTEACRLNRGASHVGMRDPDLACPLTPFDQRDAYRDIHWEGWTSGK
jgi:hypothetical protein